MSPSSFPSLMQCDLRLHLLSAGICGLASSSVYTSSIIRIRDSTCHKLAHTHSEGRALPGVRTRTLAQQISHGSSWAAYHTVTAMSPNLFLLLVSRSISASDYQMRDICTYQHIPRDKVLSTEISTY
jgi:hypothetical protein